MRVVGYCRADPASPGIPTDLASQRSAITAEADRRGWTLVDAFEDVTPGHSLLQRGGLDGALGAVESRAAKALIVTDMTRLCTSLEDTAWLLHSSKRRSWTLVSIAEPVDTSDPRSQPLLTVFDSYSPVLAYVTFDCAEPDALADFWAAVTRSRKEWTPEHGEYAVVSDLSGRGPAFWFNKVPEPKVVKNRVHVCLNAHGLNEEVERIVGLGARLAAEHSSPSGKSWVVMQDPEGNEFCLIAR
jgi:predicted enzyme related to lactoylglutathione lyase